MTAVLVLVGLLVVVAALRAGVEVGARRTASALRSAGFDVVAPILASRRPPGFSEAVARGDRGGHAVVVERWRPTMSAAGTHTGRPCTRVVVATAGDARADDLRADDLRRPGHPWAVARRTGFVVDQATSTAGLRSVAMAPAAIEVHARDDEGDAEARGTRLVAAVGDLMAGDPRTGVQEVVWGPDGVVVVLADAIAAGPVEAAVDLGLTLVGAAGPPVGRGA